ncbi:MAG: glycerophosphodiester phosphodiesterase [Anaerolineales bacterium]|nr:glycerophosphodiester phosphodiesterase [Anaerolineales bacterium]MDW8276445.1 glycerophosphodiester phosphodiesterase [Anaerolineales bacterium]
MLRNILRIVVASLAVLLLFVFLVNLLARPVSDHPYYANRPAVMVIAHQGGDGLWPGNTLFAFQNAAALGVDVLEMDLHITRDEVLVLIHDETVDRTTNGRGAVEEMTLAELQALDAGYHWSPDGGQTFPFRGQGITIPTLEEVFRAFPDLRMVIEIKKTERSMAQPLCDLIRRYDRQKRVLVASFHDQRMDEFRAVCPEVATSSARQETTAFVLLSKVFLNGLLSPAYQSLQVPESSSGIPVMTPQFVRAAHARNLKVEPWTIDDPAQMRAYLAWGVDGIITDRPDLLLEVLGKR